MEIYVRQIANEWVVKCARTEGKQKGREEVKQNSCEPRSKIKLLPMIGKPNTLAHSVNMTPVLWLRACLGEIKEINVPNVEL